MKQKLFNIYCKLVRFFNADLIPPLIIWEPTLACNFRCKFCGFYGLGGCKPDLKKELSFVQIEKMLKNLPWNVFHVGITGGEPFLRKDFGDILCLLTELGIGYSITSNGYFIDEKIVSADYFIPTEVRISLHGPKKVHDATVRVKGAFDRVLKNIDLLRKNNIPVLINCVITDYNVDELIDMKRLATEHGCKIRFQHLEFITNGAKNAHKICMRKLFGEDLPVKYGTTKLSQKSVEQLLDFVRTDTCGSWRDWREGLFEPDVYYPLHITRYYTDFSWKNSKYCFSVWGAARINPYGDVYPCVDYYFGNLTEQSLEKVWKGEKAQKFRAKLRKHKLFPGCLRCCKL